MKFEKELKKVEFAQKFAVGGGADTTTFREMGV